ncbi:MAG: sigma factor [Ferruginibacter sp.]
MWFVLPYIHERGNDYSNTNGCGPKQNISNTIKDMSKRLFSFIKQRVASNEDAEDILQDVFYQFCRQPRTYRTNYSMVIQVAPQ